MQINLFVRANDKNFVDDVLTSGNECSGLSRARLSLLHIFNGANGKHFHRDTHLLRTLVRNCTESVDRYGRDETHDPF